MITRSLVLALLALLPVWASAQILTVETVRGAAELQLEGGTRQSLGDGQFLQAGNRIITPPQGRVRLAFARYGFIDIGPDSEVLIERIPHASFATDLRSVFRLQRGYLRMVWKHPQISTFWPIFIYLGDQRASLSSGEFFIENRDGRRVACVAAGQLALTDPQSDAPQTLHPQACYRLYRGMPPQRVLRDQDDWVAIREHFDIGELPLPAPAVPVAQGDVADARRNAPLSAPLPMPPVRPVITQAPAPSGKPAPLPEQPVAADPVASGKGPWAVSIASFRDVGAAQQLRDRLRGEGFAAARVVPVTVKGELWSRVILSGFDSVAQARAAGAAVEARMGLKGAWVLRYEPDA